MIRNIFDSRMRRMATDVLRAAFPVRTGIGPILVLRSSFCFAIVVSGDPPLQQTSLGGSVYDRDAKERAKRFGRVLASRLVGR